MYVQGAVSIVLGVLLGVGVAPFHGGTPPEDLQAVLPQVAANDYWVVVHLAQFVGDVLVLVGFVALYRSITQGERAARPGALEEGAPYYAALEANRIERAGGPQKSSCIPSKQGPGLWGSGLLVATMLLKGG